VQKLAQALELSVPALFALTGPNNHTGQLLEILLVEDNPRDVELTRHAFEKAGITNPIRVARDGVEALDIIFGKGRYAAPAGLGRPQIVLLDLNLPKKSGLDVLRQIKTNVRTRHIPVIILTASSQDRDIKECRRLGVVSYIIKPVRFQDFSEMTTRLSLGWALVRPPDGNVSDTAGGSSKPIVDVTHNL
jgi:two-component system response regulator